MVPSSMQHAISFIVPAFNCEGTVTESIRSILRGNCGRDDEIVVVDDGSTDRTWKILSRLSESHANLRLIRHERNLGGAAARNSAVRASSRDLIFCLDSDNVLLPESVERLVRVLDDRNADVAAFGAHRYFKRFRFLCTHKWTYKPGEITFADLFCGYINPASSGNYLFTRRSWDQAGGYPTFAGALDAWGFGVRQVGHGAKMVTVPNSYYLHRLSDTSYWIRWSARPAKARAATALEILSPFWDRLTEGSKAWIGSEQGAEEWFDQLQTNPLLLRGSAVGIDGRAARLLCGSLGALRTKLMTRLRRGWSSTACNGR